MTVETGWYPLPRKYCQRCGGECDPLYALCANCRDCDLIIPDAERIVQERSERIEDGKTNSESARLSVPLADCRVLRGDDMDTDTSMTGSPLVDEIDRLIAEAKVTADAGKRAAENLSRMCQCAHPDIVLENALVFCAFCGGDVDPGIAAFALYDPLDDVADSKICNRFGCPI